MTTANPSDDQRVMLAIRGVTSEESLLDLMQELLPFHSANLAALSAQNKVTAYECASIGEANEMLAAIREDKRVSPAILSTVETNFSRMKEVVWGNIPRFVLMPE